MVPRLPIDDILPEFIRALAKSSTRVIVVEAPPGAGKTTRLPAAVLDQAWHSGPIIVSEPRRIAARLAAHRVADERAEKLAALVGYQVRFEDKTSAKTRLIFMTEGLLLRKLLDEPSSIRNSIVFIDEVHERSADLDTILALLKDRLKRSAEFKVVLMSATLNADKLVGYFGNDTLRFVSAGKSYPVSVSHIAQADERPLPIQIRSAVREAIKRPGDVLVFLPGAAEIRSCGEALSQLSDLRVQSLHGDMPLFEQSRVVGPNRDGQRVVLATNIAESSLTIESVTTVVDTGLARAAIFDPWSGVSRLDTVTISQARAIQRAGRAGRVSEGHVIRLYTQGQFETRPVADTPELLRSDLSELYLKLLGYEYHGGTPFVDLAFLDPPADHAIEKARALLSDLGAIHSDKLTEIGIQMNKFALSPRLARVVIEGHRLGILAPVCSAVALLSERDIIISARRSSDQSWVQATDSDLDERVERLAQLKESHFDRRLARDLDVDLQTAKQVDNVARSVLSQAQLSLPRAPELRANSSVTQALLAGFPDRVAATRGEGRDAVLQTGTQATLSSMSGVTSPLFLAVSMDAPGGRSRKPVVRMAARLDPDWLMEFDSERISAWDEFIYDELRARVEVISRLSWGKVVLDETRHEASPGKETQTLLTQAVLAKGPGYFDPEGQLAALYFRLQLLLNHRSELLNEIDATERALLIAQNSSETVFTSAVIAEAAQGATNLNQLLQHDLAQVGLNLLPPSISRAALIEVPTEVRLSGGLSVPVHYEADRPPWIEARLQNFFSMTDTPRICRGRVPLQIHLLAPNHRAVQVTSDLEGFWQRHYPELRKQLMRRYPKHLWPEDGRTAMPPSPGRIR